MAPSLPAPAHLYFIVKHLLPHHVALVVGGHDAQQPEEERKGLLSSDRFEAVGASALGPQAAEGLIPD